MPSASSVPTPPRRPAFGRPCCQPPAICSQLPCRRSGEVVCDRSYPQHHRRRRRAACPSSPRGDPPAAARQWEGPPDHKLAACPSRQSARPLQCTAPLAPVNTLDALLALYRFRSRARILALSVLSCRSLDATQRDVMSDMGDARSMTSEAVSVALTCWSDGRWPPRSSLAPGPPSWAR